MMYLVIGYFALVALTVFSFVKWDGDVFSTRYLGVIWGLANYFLGCAVLGGALVATTFLILTMSGVRY